MFLRQNSSRVIIWGIDIWAFCGSVGSCVGLCLTMLIEGSTGTDVKRAFTSYDVMTSTCSNLTC